MRKSKPLADRFHDCYTPEPNSGCFLWERNHYTNGYGQFSIGHEGKRLAHRVAYELHFGPIPEGMCVCHKCDVRSCVNPDHLFLTTQAGNLHDMTVKGRRANDGPGASALRGERSPLSKLTPQTVQEIRCAIGTQIEVATRFGISQQHVSQIKHRKRWRHLS